MNTLSSLGTKKLQLRWWHAVIGYGIAIVCSLAVPLLLIGMGEQAMQYNAVLVPIQFLAMFVVGVLAVRMLRGHKFVRQDLGFVKPSVKELLYGIGGAVLFVVVAQLASMLTPELSDAGKKVAQQVGMGENFWRDMLVVLSATVAAPLGEEIIYRGIVFRGLHDGMKRLKQQWTQRLAFIVPALVSAVLFATSHGGEGQDKQVLYLIFFGLIAAWLYWKTKSLYVSVFMHSVTNMINFFLLALATTNPVSIWVYVLILVSPCIAMGCMMLADKATRPAKLRA